jgi:parallel beta-helix repeat protein
VAQVEKNVVRKNKKDGIYVESGAQAQMDGNTLEDNGGAGIAVTAISTHADLTNNKARHNALQGITFCYGAAGTAQGNTCSENGAAGIGVFHWKSSPSLKDNQCLANGKSGIRFGRGAAGSADGNSCRDNRGYGILVEDEGTQLTLGQNPCEKNDAGPTGRLPGNPVARQEQIRNRDVGYLLYAGLYPELEELAKTLRDNHSRYPQGDWQLHDFYVKLANVSWTWLPKIEGRELFAKNIKGWQSAFPDSVAAPIALAKAHIEYAWDARGDVWGSEVTPEGAKGFKDHLNQAKNILDQAQSLPEKDPELFTAYVLTGMGLDYSKDQLYDFVRKGAAIDPTYGPLYKNCAYALLPRWGGAPGDTEDLIDFATQTSQKEMGEQMYAFLVFEMLGWVSPTDLMNGRFGVWARVNQGFDQLTAAFPDSRLYPSAHFRLACAYRDLPAAKQLLQAIGDEYVQGAWPDRAAYNRCRMWVGGANVTPINESDWGDHVYSLRRRAQQLLSIAGVAVGVIATFLILGSVAAYIALRRKKKATTPAPPPFPPM